MAGWLKRVKSLKRFNLKRQAGVRLLRVWWALVGSWNFILGAVGFGYGFWRAFYFCFQTSSIPSSLFLEVSCGCQTEVGRLLALP